MNDLSHLRADFPVLGRKIGGNDVHFLDSAASAQKPVQVLEAMDTFARTEYANVHRGAYTLSVESTERFEEARRRVATFIGAGSPGEVAFTRGATTSLNMVASGWGSDRIRPGDRIVLSVIEHHANLIPWQMLAKRTGATLEFIPITDDFRFDVAHYEKILGTDVKIVAVTGMSNVLGNMPPLRSIIDSANSVGAITVVDAAQLVPHSPVDVTSLGADFLAFSSHKMLGPTGIGVLWGKPERLEEMQPIEFGGEMISDVTLESSTWAPVPHRFEAGTPSIIEAVGLTAAIDYLEAIGMEKVAAHDRSLTEYALSLLSEIAEVTVYGPPMGPDRGGVISFTLGDIHPHDLATILDQHGVSVRAGHHCAKPLMRHLGVTATARASFYVYSDHSDVDALMIGLRAAKKLFGI